MVPRRVDFPAAPVGAGTPSGGFDAMGTSSHGTTLRTDGSKTLGMGSEWMMALRFDLSVFELLPATLYMGMLIPLMIRL